jgi:hypothetical protein
MPNVFLKVNSNFLTEKVEDPNLPIDQFNNKEAKIELEMSTDGLVSVGFNVSLENLVSGKFTISDSEKALNICCQGTFKLSIRPQYMDMFLDLNRVWTCPGLRYKAKDGSSEFVRVASGLDIQIEKFKNRFGNECESRKCIIPVRTALKAKELA